MRSARFGFNEESDRPILAYQCPTCGFIVHAKYQPLPWKGPGHECRYVLVEPMTEPRRSRMPKMEATT
jgi:hypothetical protein